MCIRDSNDPHEWTNLASNPNYVETKAELREALFEIHPKATAEQDAALNDAPRRE